MIASVFFATVLITTKNRKDDLLKAIESVLTQTVPVEIIVVDDGSTDGTADAVRDKFPLVKVFYEEISKGYIHQRNFGARQACTNIIFSIDDDAIFTATKTIEETLALFDNARVGAVTIPFVNVNQSPKIRQISPDSSGCYVTSTYVGTAYALRRDVFLALGGYRTFLVHQGEESDYCIRMLDAGYVVRLGKGEPIHHFQSPKRDFTRMHFYGTRNAILFTWYNVPWRKLPFHLVATSINNLTHAWRIKAFKIKFKALMMGYYACFKQFRSRRPVALKSYVLFRQLGHHADWKLEQIESRLPPLRQDGMVTLKTTQL